MSTTVEVTLDPEKVYEIVDGRPEEKEMGGARHGGIGMRLAARLTTHAETNRLGSIYGPDTSFKIGRNERIPDISFVALTRIPAEGEPEGPWPIAPDLAVEIVSPNDIYDRVVTKVHEYLAAGVRQVWLVSPEHRTVTIYKSATDVLILEETDDLDGGDVLPGFRCRLAEIFRSPQPA